MAPRKVHEMQGHFASAPVLGVQKGYLPVNEKRTGVEHRTSHHKEDGDR